MKEYSHNLIKTNSADEKMRCNLSSLAPDSFILGPETLLSQFSPAKILNIPGIEKTLEKEHQFNHASNYMHHVWGAEIHLTSRCPLRCLRCSYGKRNQELSELSIEIVRKLLNEMNAFNVGSVIFSGGGEPLTWNGGKFSDCLRSGVNYKQSVATNGLNLKRALNKETLQKLDIIQIAINGYDKKSYLNTTQADMFHVFINNIQWLLTARDKRITQVTGKIVIDNNNYTEVDKYLQLCAYLGFDVVVVKLAGNFEHGQNVALNQDQKDTLRKLIYQSSVLAQYPKKIDAITTDDNSIELELPEKCWVVEHGLYMLIRSNGDIFPCVTSPYTPDNRIGNVYNCDLAKIWGGDYHNRIKKKLTGDMRSSRCNLCICRHMRYNFLLDKEKETSKLIDLPLKSKEKPILL